MKLFVLKAAVGVLLFIGGVSYAEEPARKISFDVTVLDRTSNVMLHQERFTFSPDGEDDDYIKLIYQIGDFFGGGLQFTLMLHPKNIYEAFISPVPDGKPVTSGIISSKKSVVYVEWRKTAYMFIVKPL
ncbi:hypothetical protein SAMN04487926_10312 [Paraburkholderia steynii]|uniref:Uncharacterized protein n=1 Tax=Paraburkholderia steynii TaxID=1245441 RepID=A0A7Z7B1Z3_9BURK|nr:hypothetical protein [Paraburkholderia steynii]SDH23818.1 hypothetical protein SAMN04487926_10312 [Paraburkholderia steynii]